jgi:membrane fusion protein (multidrug efflux system)
MLPTKIKLALAATAVLSAIAVVTWGLARPGILGLKDGSGGPEQRRKVVVTSPKVMDVALTEKYACQLHAQRHIQVKALEKGYLNDIAVKDGQFIKQGDAMFKVIPISREKLDAKTAKAKLAELELEYEYARKLFEEKMVSSSEVRLHKLRPDTANAEPQVASAELNFTVVKAPFDGIVGALRQKLGTRLEEGAILTTLSDVSVVWADFDVPEARADEYLEGVKGHPDDQKVELLLAEGGKFNQFGKIVAIDDDSKIEAGRVLLRADFPNPERRLRHGRNGTVVIHHTVHGAIVVPRRAVFEILDNRYVYVVDTEGVVHQREIVIKDEVDDLFVISKGIAVGDRIILEGNRQVRYGEKVESEFRLPEEVMR